MGEPGEHLRLLPGGPAWEALPSFSMVARRVSWGSQSMEVRLLSRSEAMVLLASVSKVPLAKGGKHLVLEFGAGGIPLFRDR